MSDKTELIAAAQINAFGGVTPGIEFNSNFGFKTASRSSDGVYVLELDHEHGVDKFVIGATRNNTASGEIAASPLDRKHVQVNTFDVDDVATDSPFFITIFRVRD